jgi:hypothetical protein
MPFSELVSSVGSVFAAAPGSALFNAQRFFVVARIAGERISLSVLHADVVFDQLSRMCDFEQTTRRYPAIINVQTRFPKMEITDKENVYGKRRTP